MILRTDTLPWPISDKLRHLIQETLTTAGVTQETGGIISFRDPNYSPDTGGFHPVEIAVARDGSLLYVTDFAYVGRPPYSELTKEIDFDFSLGTFQHIGREYPILEGRGLFRLWQSNFIEYYHMDVYTVSVQALGGC